MYIGNPIYQVAFLTDQFSGNGSTTAFTMSVAPANTSSVLVVVSGVVQDPSTYSVSGTTLTFSQAPPTGTGNISARYLGIPASNVTTTAYRTVTEFTATSGQTTFTPPSYTAGFINVYRNGVRLTSTDYTASNGTTVVLNNGCTTGDTVTVESFLVSSVLNAIPATNASITSSYLASGLTLTSPTLTSPTINGMPVMGASIITSGTAVASTSGTSIDFTSIPSWVKRITVMFSGVSLSGTSAFLIQLGTTNSIETTGYDSVSSIAISGASMSVFTSTAGFYVFTNNATYADSGSIIFTNITGNTWVAQGNFSNSTVNPYVTWSAGTKSLSAVINKLRITTVNGTDTFDAGSINILYE
jgi:hypothetical protein